MHEHGTRQECSPPRRDRVAGVLLIALTVALAAVVARPESATSGRTTGTFYGAPARVGAGTARAYVTLEKGAPVELGVALSEAALRGLPGDHDGHDVPGRTVMPDGHTTYEIPLASPAQNPTPYRQIVLGWNPAGHEPPELFGVPHFDFHFYTITEAERTAIVPTASGFQEAAARYPAPELVPAGYFSPAPHAVPRMGVHWLPADAPELKGQPFAKIFLYGSWDGRVTFAEPMITKAYLETRPDFRAPLPRAKRYAPAGYHPGGWRVRYDAAAREYRVALADFFRTE